MSDSKPSNALAVGFVSRAKVKPELILPDSDPVSVLLTVPPRAFLLTPTPLGILRQDLTVRPGLASNL